MNHHQQFQILRSFRAGVEPRLRRVVRLRRPARRSRAPAALPTPFPRPALPRRRRRAIGVFSALGLALLNGACGMSARFGLPAAAIDGSGSSSDRTDSIDLISALSAGAFSDDDLIVASMTAARLLERGKGGPWENPQTNARGTITPIAAVYRDNGAECRDFLVSYVHDRAEAWMQGEACRVRAGHWEVRSLKPWRR